MVLLLQMRVGFCFVSYLKHTGIKDTFPPFCFFQQNTPHSSFLSWGSSGSFFFSWKGLLLAQQNLQIKFVAQLFSPIHHYTTWWKPSSHETKANQTSQTEKKGLMVISRQRRNQMLKRKTWLDDAVKMLSAEENNSSFLQVIYLSWPCFCWKDEKGCRGENIRTASKHLL